MKKIKNLILILFALIFSRSLFAEINTRWITIGSPSFYEGIFLINYEFEVEEANVMALGLEGGLILTPYVGINASWIKCLQPNSQKKYRFYLEAELHGGINFWRTKYINPNGQETKIRKRTPFISTDVLLTFKPTPRGFYGGIGPSVSFTTYQMDGKREYLLNPALFIALGVKFTEL